jgi:hypothetical protein
MGGNLDVRYRRWGSSGRKGKRADRFMVVELQVEIRKWRMDIMQSLAWIVSSRWTQAQRLPRRAPLNEKASPVSLAGTAV